MYFLILVSSSCNFDKPFSLKVIIKCLVLHSGGIRFPPKERGFFLTGSRHVSLSCSCYTHTSCITSGVTINKVGLLLARSRAISVWGPNLVQQPVSYLPVKSCLLSDWGYRVNLLFAAVRKNSSKLTFSRSTEVLTVALATSELKACAGGILLRGIILHWQRCSLRVLV